MSDFIAGFDTSDGYVRAVLVQIAKGLGMTRAINDMGEMAETAKLAQFSSEHLGMHISAKRMAQKWTIVQNLHQRISTTILFKTIREIQDAVGEQQVGLVFHLEGFAEYALLHTGPYNLRDRGSQFLFHYRKEQFCLEDLKEYVSFSADD